jgi:tRNA modification GTPase
MNDHDTICAASTPPGEGGIGIVRVSGRKALSLVSTIFKSPSNRNLLTAPSHTIHYGRIVKPESGGVVDEVLVTVMRAPSTYTREDVVEINCHGGALPLQRTVSLLIEHGARPAEPGEFTKRAFLNGRIDLAQAEAVMDIINAKTELSLRSANEQLLGGLSREIRALRDRLVALLASVEAGIDFPEEDIETPGGAPLSDEISRIRDLIVHLIDGHRFGRILRQGYAAAIVGRPNVGKSSLLNALLKQNRAIVTDIPGTTRDVLEEYLNIGGVPFRILDTAGIRHSHDLVEQEGVRRSLAAIDAADIALVMLDGSQRLTAEDRHVLSAVKNKQAIAVVNKSDLQHIIELPEMEAHAVRVSCRTGDGLADLKQRLSDLVRLGAVAAQDHAWVINERHKAHLELAGESLRTAFEASTRGLSPEFIALDLRHTLDSLGLIIGETHTDDILEQIFSRFCIGK